MGVRIPSRSLNLTILEQILFYALLFGAIFNLLQIFFYGLQENNRANILFGIVLLFFAFAFPKPLTWIKWGLIIVSITGFIGTLSGFSDSLKPNWLNYLTLILYLALSTLSIVYFFVL